MIHVELIHATLARVTTEPSLLARIVLGRRLTERYAVRLPAISGGFRWLYDDTSKAVEPTVLAAISEAEHEQRRPVLRRAVEPPGG